MEINGRHAGINHIYHQLKKTGARSLAITACNPQEGVTTVATALTECALLAGEPTLLVDLNLTNPTLHKLELADDHAAHLSAPPLELPQWVHHAAKQQVFYGLPTPSHSQLALSFNQPDRLRQAITQWLQEFSLVIIDAGAVNYPEANLNTAQVIAAPTIVDACEQCLLVVRSNVTTEADLDSTLKTLQRQNFTLLGTVMNDQHNPSLLFEMLRELDRLPKFLQPVHRYLRRRLLQFKPLNVEI